MLVWEASLRRVVLLMTIVGIPLLMLPGYTLDPFNVPKLALLLVGTGLALGCRAVGLAAGSPRPAIPNRLVLPIGLLTLPLLLSWLIASPYRGWALWGEYERYGGLLPQIVFALFALLVVDTFSDRRQDLLTALTIAGLAMGLYTVLQRLELDPFVWSGAQNGATLGNPNYSGSFLAICLPVASWGAFRATGRHRDLAQLAVLPILAGLVLAFSQGGWVAAAVGGAILIAGASPSARWKWLFTAFGGMLALGVALAVPLSLTDPGERLLGVTVQDRAYAARAAIEMAGENPILGRGPDAFAVEGIRYRTQSQAANAIATIDDPHSAVLYYLTSAGVLGALGFLGAAAFLLRTSWSSTDAYRPVVLASGSAYLTATLVTHDQPALRMTFWIVMALVASGSFSKPFQKSGTPSPAAALPVGAVGIALIGCGWAFISGDHASLYGSRAAVDNQPTKALPLLESSLDFDPTLQHRKLFAQRVGELGTRRGTEGKVYFHRSKALFSYLDEFPDVDGYVRAGRLAFAWGLKVDREELTRSTSLFAQARSLDRYHPVLAAEEADVLLEVGRSETATVSLEKIRVEEIPFPFYWATLAEAYVAQEQYALAYGALGQAFARGRTYAVTIAAGETFKEALRLFISRR